jgi:hypothetical protein
MFLKYTHYRQKHLPFVTGLADLAFQRIFNHTTGNHHGLVFNHDVQLLTGNRIRSPDVAKHIDTEFTRGGITVKYAALFFHRRSGSAEYILRCTGKRNAETTF